MNKLIYIVFFATVLDFVKTQNMTFYSIFMSLDDLDEFLTRITNSNLSMTLLVIFITMQILYILLMIILRAIIIVIIFIFALFCVIFLIKFLYRTTSHHITP